MRRLIMMLSALLLMGAGLACEREQQQAEEAEQKAEEMAQTAEEKAQAAKEKADEEAESAEERMEEGMEAIEEALGVEDTEDKTIAEVVGDSDSLSTLADALDAADLTDVLDGEGPYTVFAPTDAAFDKLEEGTLESLLKEENKEKLQRILKFHVLSGETMADAVEAGNVETVAGVEATIEVSEDGKEVTYQGAKVTNTDLQTSNGVIHLIDQVAMPPEEGSTM